ncbi:type VI secretion system protein TssA [Silvimonas sp.]|uniref:type VI secretion system protein TssA n=1 Tax=Silvimonas sp. TaxID=2650811 RepID=UPI0028437770|nr:type VI secretion system protein TssA [Silvimonas sp.]MDR3428731.1 type VI secretion system protein TssA [Silvimonas sp.]
MSLPSFLKKLFGQSEPADLARNRLATWQDWLSPIPGASEVGDDPGYDDDFLALREEVAKLGGLDDALILNTSEALLRNHCKDLRPAGYYAFSRLRTDGAAGLADGLELIAALLVRYPETILPHRPESRKAALEWLNGERFQVFLERSSGARTDLERACSALALIEQLVGEWDAAFRPSVQPLIHRFEALIEANDASEQPGSSNRLGTANSLEQTSGTSTLVPTRGEIASARELLDRAREMAVHLRRQAAGYLPAYRLLRCIRWDTVTNAPPHDPQGKTRLPPPRSELHQHLKRLVLQQQWHELLERVELAFAEGANHFWLDLQYYAWQAQGQAGPEYLACRDMLLTDFAQMLDRLTGLERLCFSDGTPFAQDATLEWIATHAVIRNLDAGETVLAPTPSGGDVDWQETERQAIELAASAGLENAFQWLRDLPVIPGERNRLMRQLLLASLAENHGRADMAMHLLVTLDRDIDVYQLGRWEPGLAFEIKVRQLRLLRQRYQRKDVDKITLASRMDGLVESMTALDPLRTLALSAPS